jgi:hypothetical protein
VLLQTGTGEIARAVTAARCHRGQSRGRTAPLPDWSRARPPSEFRLLPSQARRGQSSRSCRWLLSTGRPGRSPGGVRRARAPRRGRGGRRLAPGGTRQGCLQGDRRARRGDHDRPAADAGRPRPPPVDQGLHAARRLDGYGCSSSARRSSPVSASRAGSAAGERSAGSARGRPRARDRPPPSPHGDGRSHDRQRAGPQNGRRRAAVRATDLALFARLRRAGAQADAARCRRSPDLRSLGAPGSAATGRPRTSAGWRRSRRPARSASPAPRW